MTNALLNKARESVGATGKDLTKPNAGGGGDFTPPEKGPTRLRLFGYVETGIHTTKHATGSKTKPRCELHFELSGPKHEPKKLDDGRLIPHRIKVKEIVGTHEKNNYIKLFNTLNVDGTAKNFIDLLMDGAWRGMVSHYEFQGRDGKPHVIAQLKGKGTGYQIFPVSFEDPESGETRTVSVPPCVSELRLFLWDDPSLEQWDTLDKYSKQTIGKAENFQGSLIYELLAEAGRLDEVKPDAEDKDAEQEEGEEGEAQPEGASLTEPAPEKPAPAAPAKPPAKPRAPAKPAAKANPPAAPSKPAKAAPAAADGDPLAGL